MAMKEEERSLLTPIEEKKKNERTPSHFEVIGFMFVLIMLFSFVLYKWFYFLGNYETRSVLTFELVCKTSDPYQIQQHLYNITADYQYYDYLSTATAEYLLEVPDQYFSARTSFKNGDGLIKEWDAYYESLAVQTTEQFFIMNRKSNNTTRDVKYVVVELIIAISRTYEIPTIETFRNVVETLLFIKSLPISTSFKAADLFWTRPLDIEDVPVLNLISLPS